MPSNAQKAANLRQQAERLVRYFQDNPLRLDMQGVFRLSGSASRVEDMLTKAGQGDAIDFSRQSTQDLGSLLKQMLGAMSELGEPLIPDDVAETLNAARTAVARPDDVVDYGPGLTNLPPERLNLLNQVLDLLVLTESRQDKNLMNSKNLSIVFGPNIFDFKNLSPQVAMSKIGRSNPLTQSLLDYHSSPLHIKTAEITRLPSVDAIYAHGTDARSHFQRYKAAVTEDLRSAGKYSPIIELSGDQLKKGILEIMAADIKKLETIDELDAYVKRMKGEPLQENGPARTPDPGYLVLAKAQGVFSSVTGRKTDSLKAFDKLIAEQRLVINEVSRSPRAR